MSTFNTPEADKTVITPPPRRKRDPRYIIYALLTTGLIAALAYIWLSKSKEKEREDQFKSDLANVDNKRVDAEQEYNAALVRLDSITNLNTTLNAEITDKDGVIAKLRSEIDDIRRSGKKDAQTMATLREKIRLLNNEIDSYKERVVQLEQQNQALTEENTVVKGERDQARTELETTKGDLTQTQTVKKQLEEQVDVGSTLHASNFSIAGINEKRSGKEKETSTAKRVDKLRISFDLDENRITPTGKKNIYVCITAPDGNPVTVEALGSGKFSTRSEGEKFYTNMVEVDYTQGERKNIQFDWKQNSDFQRGDYKVEVYQNGFRIGEGKVTLKKGGLFG